MAHKYHHLPLLYLPGVLYPVKLIYVVGKRKRPLNLFIRLERDREEIFSLPDPRLLLEEKKKAKRKQQDQLRGFTEPLLTPLASVNTKSVEKSEKEKEKDAEFAKYTEEALTLSKLTQEENPVLVELGAFGTALRWMLDSSIGGIQTKNVVLERIVLKDATERTFEFFTGQSLQEMVELTPELQEETFRAARFVIQTTDIEDPNFYINLFGVSKKMNDKRQLVEDLFVKKQKLPVIAKRNNPTKAKIEIPVRFYPAVKVSSRDSDFLGEDGKLDYNKFYKNKKIVSCTFLSIDIRDRRRKKAQPSLERESSLEKEQKERKK